MAHRSGSSSVPALPLDLWHTIALHGASQLQLCAREFASLWAQLFDAKEECLRRWPELAPYRRLTRRRAECTVLGPPVDSWLRLLNARHLAALALCDRARHAQTARRLRLQLPRPLRSSDASCTLEVCVRIDGEVSFLASERLRPDCTGQGRFVSSFLPLSHMHPPPGGIMTVMTMMESARASNRSIPLVGTLDAYLRRDDGAVACLAAEGTIAAALAGPCNNADFARRELLDVGGLKLVAVMTRYGSPLGIPHRIAVHAVVLGLGPRRTPTSLFDIFRGLSWN